MSPRTGRPPSDNPKDLNTRIRLSESDRKKLNFSAEILGLTKAEIIRQGINEMYEKVKKEIKK